MRTVPPSGVGVTWRREIALGGDPNRALARALCDAPVRLGELWDFRISHDAECPCLAGRPMGCCTCEIVEVAAKRAA